MAWDGQGGRNFSGPLMKNAGPRGLSSLDVIIQGGYLPTNAGPVEYAAWLREPVLDIAADLTTTISEAIGDQLAPYIATVVAIGDAAEGVSDFAEGEALAAHDFATAADASATAAAASLAALLANKATAAEIAAGVEDTKFATSKGFVDSAAFVATSGGEISSGTVTFDGSKGSNRKHTMTANTTLAAPTNLKDGITYVFMINAGAGGFTMAALPAIFDLGTGTTPVFNTAAGKINKLICQYDAGSAKLQTTFWRQ